MVKLIKMDDFNSPIDNQDAVKWLKGDNVSQIMNPQLNMKIIET